MAQVFRPAPPPLNDPLNAAVAAGAQPVLPPGGMQPDPVVGGLDALFRQFLLDYSPPDYDPAAAAAATQSQGGATGASGASQQQQSEGGGNGDGNTNRPRSYMSRAVEEMATSGTTVLYVDYAFLHDFNDELADAVRDHYGRAEPLMRRALQQHVRQHHPDYLREAHGVEKEFFVGVHNLPAQDALRDLKTEAVGHLVAFSGTVTRASEVRPELFLGTFTCQVCRTVVRGVEQQYKYTTPLVCPNPQCNNKAHWHLERDQSTFVDWQRLKVQESVDEIPSGCLPRAMDVILRANNVEAAKAGDRVQLTGTLCVCPDVAALAGPGERVTVKAGAGGAAAGARADALGDGVTGLRQLGARELTYRLVFAASTVRPAQQRDGMVSVREAESLTPEDVLAEYSESDVRELEAMRRSPSIYSDLYRSICPGVYGHDSIKQAVLLMLFGGVHKRTAEGISLRGDINVAVVGDPSCAKSQVLKYVAAFLPRAVYTSGKASTAAGLTASVVKEPENGEFAIEAGALMLADNGICCIDEFDKMDVKDQVAIHEAMEQQTISIAKAGVQATLNARASILAAANPVGGRYDKSKPLKWNVALPPAILSRFDLLHVMVDDTTEYVDERIARHIVEMHRDPAATLAHAAPYPTDALQRYIRYARSIVPVITPEARQALVRAYKRLRADDAAPGTATAYRITVRQLEALVRLSEATARVYCSEEVRPEHVREAARLLQSSILKVEQGDVALDDLVGPGDGGGAGGAGAGGAGGAAAPPAEEDEAPAQQAAAAAAAAAGGTEAAADPLGAGAFLAGHGIAAPTQAVADASGPAPMDEDGAGAAADGAGGSGANAASATPRPQEPVKISAQEYERIKAMLLRRLREREDAVRAEEARAEPAAAPAADANAAAGPSTAATTAADPLPADPQGAAAASRASAARYGVRQQELVDWYMERLIDQRVVSTYEQGERAYHLAFRVINHLVRREGLVVVVTVPRRRDGEAEAAFRGRLWRERVLALSPSYVPE